MIKFNQYAWQKTIYWYEYWSNQKREKMILKKIFSAIEMKKTGILIYKSVCLGLSILELSETLKYCCMTFGMIT